MNWKIKNKKGITRFVLLCGVLGFGLSACNKSDEVSQSNEVKNNVFKGATHSFAAEVFDEVMEIGDETLDLYEMFLYNMDSTMGHGYLDMDSIDAERIGMDGFIGMGGMSGMGGNGTRNHMDGSEQTMDFDDLDMMGGSMGNGDHLFRLSECTEVSQIVEADQTVTIVNFGESNCKSFDGKQRRGKINISIKGDYWKGNAEVIFTFEDYYVDDNQIVGNKTVNTFINTDGNRESRL